MPSYFCEIPRDPSLWLGFSDRTVHVSALQYFRVGFPSPKSCRALERSSSCSLKYCQQRNAIGILQRLIPFQAQLCYSSAMIEENTLKIAKITCGGIACQVINGICQLWSDKTCNRKATKDQSHVVLIDAEIGSGSELSSRDIWGFFPILQGQFGYICS